MKTGTLITVLLCLVSLSAGCSSFWYDDFDADRARRLDAAQNAQSAAWARLNARLAADRAADQAKFEANQAELAARGIYPIAPSALPTSPCLPYDDSWFESWQIQSELRELNYGLSSELRELNYQLQQIRFQNQMRDIRNMYKRY